MHEGRLTGVLERSAAMKRPSCGWAVGRDDLPSHELCLTASFLSIDNSSLIALNRYPNYAKRTGNLVLLVALCVVVAIINPRFLSPANLQNMARLIGLYGIFSIGMGIVIITGGIDLSVGSVFALLGCLCR